MRGTIGSKEKAHQVEKEKLPPDSDEVTNVVKLTSWYTTIEAVTDDRKLIALAIMAFVTIAILVAKTTDLTPLQVALISLLIVAICVIAVIFLRSNDKKEQVSSTTTPSITEEQESVLALPNADETPDCGFLKRFSSKVEAPFDSSNTAIKGDRAYRLLDYLFANEDIKSGFTIDLAFYRWLELAVPSQQQTINISKELLESIEELSQRTTFQGYKRIIVLTDKYLVTTEAWDSLEIIHTLEKKIEQHTHERKVETRILKYDDCRRPIKDKIAETHDFVVVMNERDKLAIIETGLSNPSDELEIRSSEFRVTTDSNKIDDLSAKFNSIWNLSQCVTIERFVKTRQDYLK